MILNQKNENNKSNTRKTTISLTNQIDFVSQEENTLQNTENKRIIGVDWACLTIVENIVPFEGDTMIIAVIQFLDTIFIVRF
jgi:hypothetical protein